MMFTDYTPKPWHLLLPALFFLGGAWPLTDPTSKALGLALYALGAGAAAWIIIAGLWGPKIEYNITLSELADTLSRLDPERWSALGLNFPELRIHFDAKPIAYLGDTDIRMDYLRRFLDDSDEHQFAPERLYGDGTYARTQWTLVRDYLTEHHYLIGNSAAGNHSWLWRTGRRRHLLKTWFGETIGVPDLNLLDAVELEAEPS